MTRSQRNANLAAVIIPFVGVIVAIISLWGRGVHAADLVVAFVLYILCGFGITVGFHRMLTHRAFQASKPVEYTFAILGSMAVQGRVIDWVADHRKHHAHSDEEGDPHSPHVGHGTGLQGPVARPRRLAVHRARPRAPRALRARPARGPRHAPDQPHVRLARRGDAA